MVHHQGMSLLAFDNALHDNVMRKRFHSDPRIRASEALLHEHIPERRFRRPPARRAKSGPAASRDSDRRRRGGPANTPDTVTPRTQLLSNGTCSVMVTNSGGGYLRWRDLDITRWRADTTCDVPGPACYIRDLDERNALEQHPSAGALARVALHLELHARQGGVPAAQRPHARPSPRSSVSAEDDAEVRRVTLVNGSRQAVPPRTDQLRRTRAGAAPGRSRASGIQQTLHRNRMAAAMPGAARPASSALAAGSAGLGRAPDGHGVARRRCSRSSKQTARVFSAAAARWKIRKPSSARLTNSVGCSPRSDLQPAPAHNDRTESALSIFARHRGRRIARGGDWVGRALLGIPHRRIALSRRRGRIRNSRCAGSISVREMCSFFNNSAPTSFSRRRNCGRHRTRLGRGAAGQRALWAQGHFGRPADRRRDDRQSPRYRGRPASSDRAHLLASARLESGSGADQRRIAESYEEPLTAHLRRLSEAHAQLTGVDQPGGVFLRSANQDFAGGLDRDSQAAARAVLVAARGTLRQQLAAPVPVSPQPRAADRPEGSSAKSHPRRCRSWN